jgi:hypothetical protein
VLWAYTVMKRLLLLALIAVACEAMAQDAKCVSERAAMVETIRAYARSDADLLGPQGISESVLEAMGQTERHRFIPGRSCSAAYMDGPVPIGQGQTISQPFIVALMTHLAAVKLDHTVLEVGRGDYLLAPRRQTWDPTRSHDPKIVERKTGFSSPINSPIPKSHGALGRSASSPSSLAMPTKRGRLITPTA